MITAKELIASFPEFTRFGFDEDRDPFAIPPNMGRDPEGRELGVYFTWEWDKPETLKALSPGTILESFPGNRMVSREEMSSWLEARI
jgi:hypothetical protein